MIIFEKITHIMFYSELLEAELEAVGIRLNQSFPNVSFKIKKAGGISFNATVKLHYLDAKMVHNILHDYSKESKQKKNMI